MHGSRRTTVDVHVLSRRVLSRTSIESAPMAFTCSRLSWLFTCERFLTDGRLNTTEFATVRQSIVTVSGLRVAARCDMRVNEETRLRAPCEMLTLSAARFWILDRRRNARLERNLARPSGHSAGCRKVSKTIKESRSLRRASATAIDRHRDFVMTTAQQAQQRRGSGRQGNRSKVETDARLLGAIAG